MYKKGVCWSQGRMFWRVRPIPWWWWIPGQRPLLKVWNKITCLLYGHGDLTWHLAAAGYIPEEDARCGFCCVRVTTCTGYCREAQKKRLRKG